MFSFQIVVENNKDIMRDCYTIYFVGESIKRKNQKMIGDHGTTVERISYKLIS